jgi:hypothetical protein
MSRTEIYTFVPIIGEPYKARYSVRIDVDDAAMVGLLFTNLNSPSEGLIIPGEIPRVANTCALNPAGMVAALKPIVAVVKTDAVRMKEVLVAPKDVAATGAGGLLICAAALSTIFSC